ncbi:MAG TPA: protein adenylyltransferase SelO family protein, partial [Mycobacterium sp.]
ETLLPLFADDGEEGIALAEASFGAFATVYDATWSSGMRAKLGLPADLHDEILTPLIDELLRLLKESRVDYTSFFRHLGDAARGGTEPARGLFADLAGFDAWLSSWRALGPDAESMDRANPIYIPRNHLVEEALTAATAGDLAPVEQLLDAVTAPYDKRAGLERYALPAPEDFSDYQTFCGT